MLARCPKCQSIFRVTADQLAARGGMVRCGKCHNPFRADLNQLAEPTTDAVEPRTSAKRAPRKKKRRPVSLNDELSAAQSLYLSQIIDAARPRLPAGVWIAGVVVGIAALVAQLVYLNSRDLVRIATLAPTIEMFCSWTGCQVKPPHDVRRIELLDRTRIAPHPNYVGVLRIRVSMVNRANFAQPFPIMEVSLTDNDGALLARRQFLPIQYQPRNEQHATSMLPDVVVNALLDVTNPGGRASGYEIRLLPAP